MEIDVNYPSRPVGDEIVIPGIGVLINGETNTVTQEQLDAAAVHGFILPESGKLGHEPFEEGPTKDPGDHWDNPNHTSKPEPRNFTLTGPSDIAPGSNMSLPKVSGVEDVLQLAPNTGASITTGTALDASGGGEK